MSAAPIARYLLELDAGYDPGATPALRPGGKSPAASKAGMLDEAHAKAFASGKAAAEAQTAAKLEEREASHRRELASAREAWTQQEGGRLAEQLVKGLEELEARLADTMARILEPFLAAELRRKAIADLVESLSALRAQDKAAVVGVSGPPDLLDALRARLEGRLDNVTYHPGQVNEVRVTLGQTILETRVGAWLTRIEEAVR